jgi:Na+/H+ antiporter NhaC
MKLTFLTLALILSGCVVLPIADHSYVNKCEISSDRKVLKVVDVAKDSNSFYSISGVVLLPITGVISGIYAGINNIYHLGEEKLICGGF